MFLHPQAAAMLSAMQQLLALRRLQARLGGLTAARLAQAPPARLETAPQRGDRSPMNCWPWRRKRQTVEIPVVGPDEVLLLTCERSLTDREAHRLQKMFTEARSRSRRSSKRSAVHPGLLAGKI